MEENNSLSLQEKGKIILEKFRNCSIVEQLIAIAYIDGMEINKNISKLNFSKTKSEPKFKIVKH